MTPDSQLTTMNSKEKTLNAVRVDIDEASRLFALKKYESASDLLASALESLYVANWTTYPSAVMNTVKTHLS